MTTKNRFMKPFVDNYKNGLYDPKISDHTLSRFSTPKVRLTNDDLSRVLFAAHSLAKEGVVELGKSNYITIVSKYLGGKCNDKQFAAAMRLLLEEGYLQKVRNHSGGIRCAAYIVKDHLVNLNP